MDATVSFEELFLRKISHIHVKGEGVVAAILNDDLTGRKHQRFILELAPHKTVMIVNNIDDFPRLENLEVGDRVEFSGEYVWNRHGGLVHWTHDDPRGLRDDGYVKIITDGEEKSPIPLGTYRHYKGKLYEVIGFAIHSETLEDMVIYKALYGERKTWARPLAMWGEIVETEGKLVKRFEEEKE